MSEKKPKKGKGIYKNVESKINLPQNDEYKIRQFMAEAEKYYNDKNYEEAVKCYDEIIKIDSAFKDAYNNRGLSYKNLGRYEEAITDFTKAIEIDIKVNTNPTYKEAYNNRGNLYNNLGRYEEAVLDFDKVIELNTNPTFKEVYNNRGFSYAKLEKYEEAVSDYTKAIEIDDKYIEAYNNRGISFAHLGDNEKAIIDFNMAIEIDIKVNTNPTYKEAYNNRGVSYYNLRDFNRAISDFDKVIEIDDKYIEAYNNRGVSYYDLRDNDKAMSDYTKAIEIDIKVNTNPTYKEAYNNRGNFYANLGKYEEAIIDFDKAIEIDDDYKEAYNNRGVSYYDLRDNDKAMSDYTKAIEIDIKVNTNPTYKEAYFNRGISYDDLGKYEEAIIDFDKAIEIDDNYKNAYFNRGLAYANLEKYDEALRDFTLYINYTDLVLYKVYFLLIKLYKTKKIDKNKIISTIKDIINKQTNDSFESKKINRDGKTNAIIDIIVDKDKNQIDINPHTLYSYVPFDKNSIDAIVQGYKYANEIFDFNDPTDPIVKLIGEKKDKEEIKELLKKIRIACFSTSPLNALMYSHYTDKHKGICIEYDFSNFNKKDTTTSTLLEVKYKEELKIDSEISQISMKSDDDTDKEISFLDLFRTKHLNWEYEKEYRVMTYDETDEVNKVGKIYLPIKAIYLGKDFPQDNRKLITELIKGKGIKLYQVRLHEHNVFRLEAEEI